MIDNYYVAVSKFRFEKELELMDDHAHICDECKLIDVDRFYGHWNGAGYRDISIRHHLLPEEVFNKLKTTNFILD